MFNFVPAAVGELDGSLEVRPTGIEWARFPARATPWGAQVELELFERGTGTIDAVLSYDVRRFGTERAHRLASGFAGLLERLAHDPDVVLEALTSATPPSGMQASSPP